MKGCALLLLFSAAISAGASENDTATAEKAVAVEQLVDGFTAHGLELILAKLDYVEHRILELQFDQHEQREDIAANHANLEKTFVDYLWALHHLEDKLDLLGHGLGRNFTVLQDRAWQILAQQTSCSNHDKLREQFFDFIPKENKTTAVESQRALLAYNSDYIFRKPNCATSTPPPQPNTTTPMIKQPVFSSCKEEPSRSSGIYQIRTKNDTEPFTAFCEQSKLGGGWLVVQHRFDGSVNFDRTWNVYRKGFGVVGGEYWIGLDRLHELTSSRVQELLVEVKKYDGTYGYAHYEAFEIGNASEEFVIKTVGAYEGNAGGSGMQSHLNYKFSTVDHNTNTYTGDSYSATLKGGWWYGPGYSHLNGPYTSGNTHKSMYWYSFTGDYYGLAYSRMMLRPSD